MEHYDQHLPLGSMVDRYRIDGVLGMGGFGVTYLATDTQLEYPVAIKEFMPDDCAVRSQSNSQIVAKTNRQQDYQYGLERFLDEAKTLAKFQHPNIVRVNNFVKANNTAYMVMEYYQGQALDDYLKSINFRGQMAESEILTIAKPILRGLEQVHQQGLLHRDIKPGNIYLRQGGEPMLIDFGAARYALSSQSQSISAIISMGYAPPEQYSSKGKQGPFSDLYALGAVLYQLISGTAPEESTLRREAMVEEEPDPLKPIHQFANGKYSTELLELIDWCLQLRTKQRPQSASEVLQRIEPFSPKPEQAPPFEQKPQAQSRASADHAPEQTAQADVSSQGTRRIQEGDHFNAERPKQNTPKTKAKVEVSHKPPGSVNKKGLAAAIAATVLLGGGAYWGMQDSSQPAKPNTAAATGVKLKSFRDSLNDGTAGPEMVLIPEGSFLMGCEQKGVCNSDEGPVRKVKVKAFAMMKYEVSNAEIAKFNNTAFKNNLFFPAIESNNLPVENLDYKYVQAYIRWINKRSGFTYRLPTEAEWEYAARAGSTGKYSWGNTINCNRARYKHRASECPKGAKLAEGPVAVGSYAANAFGLHDMHGNVLEWVADCYHDNYLGAPTTARVWNENSKLDWTGETCQHKVARGGGWNTAASELRVSNRIRSNLSNDWATNGKGFRLVRDL